MKVIGHLSPVSDLAKQGWVDCLRHAASETGIVKQFCADTGTTMDNVSGDDEALGLAFTKWFNANIWGELDGRACNGDED